LAQTNQNPAKYFLGAVYIAIIVTSCILLNLIQLTNARKENKNQNWFCITLKNIVGVKVEKGGNLMSPLNKSAMRFAETVH